MREVDDGLSLELLRSFVVLHRERHLSRAARKVGLSQPAMSRALGKLREVFGDALFVRTPRGMIPTVKADGLVERVKGVLDAVGGLVKGKEFVARELVRTFVIVTTGFVDAELLTRLAKVVAEEAPGVSIETRAMAEGVGEGLASGRLDLLVGVRQSIPSGMQVTRLYEESWMCGVRSGLAVGAGGAKSGAGKRMSLERYLELGHVVIAPSGNPGSVVDGVLERMGKKRRVVMRVHAFATAPAVVAGSDLVITAPKRVMEEVAARYGLRLVGAPSELGLERFPVLMAWHPRVQEDAGHRWLREKVKG